jgi:hypothetical protein
VNKASTWWVVILCVVAMLTTRGVSQCPIRVDRSGSPGMNGDVYALAVLPNGDLIAGGNFTTAGGTSANGIARWNGTSWSALGTGMNFGVYALAVLPNGDLIAGGSFTTAGGTTANRIARWNGTAWSALGPGMNDWVDALSVLPNGDLIAGGSFTTAGDQVSAYWARYSMTGAPAVAVSPSSQASCAGHTLTLTASPANGFSSVSFQWRRNGTNITNGAGGASSGGGSVSGASGAFSSPTSAASTTLTIASLAASDAGSYTCVFTNGCGSATTTAATLTVESCEPPCPADFNQDGGVDGLDVASFFAAWQVGDTNADVNQDGGVDGMDVQAFFVVWEAGGC